MVNKWVTGYVISRKSNFVKKVFSKKFDKFLLAMSDLCFNKYRSAFWKIWCKFCHFLEYICPTMSLDEDGSPVTYNDYLKKQKR